MVRSKCIDKIVFIVPWVPALLFLIINWKSRIITKTLPGMPAILDSIINFTSIIIGVLIALFGVIVTITDSDVMKKLKGSYGDKQIFKYSLETLISNFIVLVLSIVLQSLVEFSKQVQGTQLIINLWSFAVVFATCSSIRTIYYLLLISFNQNDETKRPKGRKTLTDDEKRKLREENSYNSQN